MNTLIIQASARPDGDTNKVVRHLAAELKADWIDLLDYKIYPFSYAQEYPGDDQFLELIRSKILTHDKLILATPVYWYTMSAQLKQFLDRISDLLMTHKDLGRQLRGKSLGSVSVGLNTELVTGFHDPFRHTAVYLGMELIEPNHGWVERNRVVLRQERGASS
ncbi:flavodoxin family protein [Neolewinella antarctica]|uniref:Multimeric flavodoxin WrbA n=1 Tax=Neolewinella antarctica TaxID=442734 RepID=A0ABX0XDC4_9BACT|nr:NAD(P)H-dependent oxidoreductase [Neolewinella antarctica]NJC27309.1 multimeric flavodoxin WrbA [Neolewinella antarctica]